MDIRQLRYFVRVIELKSLTKAAEQLRVAQPALGLQIRKLEEELQVRLLVRHSRGVEPTEAGRLLFEGSTEILDKIEAMRLRLLDLSGQKRGRFTIGMTPSINFMLATALIRRCSAELPNVSLSIVEELSSVLIEWVESKRVDFALAYDTGRGKLLHSEPVLDEELFFVQAPTGGGHDGDPIAFVDAAKHALVMPGLPHGLRRLLEEIAASKGVVLNIAFEIPSVATVRELVEQRIGVTVLPYGAIAMDVELGRLCARRIVEPTITRTVSLIALARRPASKAETDLRKLIKEIVAKQIGRAIGVGNPARQAG